MKIIYMECDAEEMKANRTLIDAFVDVGNAIVAAFNAPISDSFEAELKKDEED